MKRAFIILALMAMIVMLGGCSVLEERYQATAAKAQAKAAEANAQVQIAHAQATETQAIQATAQVAQVEASNRLMAFLGTLAVLSQSNVVLVASFVLAFGIAAGAFITFGTGGKRR